MRAHLFCLSAIFALFSLVSVVTASASETSSVLDLTKSADFDAAVGKDRGALVEFFAPWCGHCKKLAPTYEQLGSAFAGKKDSVLIGKVDADANKELGKRFGIRGYPTLVWFKPKSLTPETYSGPRDLENMIRYVVEMSGQQGQVKPAPPPKAVQLNAGNFDSIVMDPSKDVLVEFYAPWCGHCKNLAPIYEGVAEAFENEANCVVAQMDADDAGNKDVAQKYGVSGFPTLMMFPKGSDKKQEAYSRGRSEDDLISYLNSKCLTFRTTGGGLTEYAGRMPLLDTLATRFYSAKQGQERKSVWEEAKVYVERVSQGANATVEKNTAARYYLKVMDKTINESGYLEKETKRLTALLKKHVEGTSQLASTKFDDLKRRANVLAAFVQREMSDKTREAAEKITKGHGKDEL